ncbi:MAG: hypothetical protein ACOYLO_07185 [Ferruginibacter sp.]
MLYLINLFLAPDIYCSYNTTRVVIVGVAIFFFMLIHFICVAILNNLFRAIVVIVRNRAPHFIIKNTAAVVLTTLVGNDTDSNKSFTC